MRRTNLIVLIVAILMGGIAAYMARNFIRCSECPDSVTSDDNGGCVEPFGFWHRVNV